MGSPWFNKNTKPTVDPQIWDHTKEYTDGRGGGQLVIDNLTAGIKFKKGALISYDLKTKAVNPVKNALVVTGGTTSAPRIKKNHLFKVGEFVYVSGDAVTINAIDTSNASYDTLTLSAACTGAVADAYLEQAVAAGATPAKKFAANALLGESIYNIQGGEPVKPVIWVMQVIDAKLLPYAVSPANLAAISQMKFNQ